MVWDLIKFGMGGNIMVGVDNWNTLDCKGEGRIERKENFKKREIKLLK